MRDGERDRSIERSWAREGQDPIYLFIYSVDKYLSNAY